jgi:hypothetical protein
MRECRIPYHSLAEIEARRREMLFRQVPNKGDLDLSVVKDCLPLQLIQRE